jgi:NADH-quinone oxidoreductase subunit N
LAACIGAFVYLRWVFALYSSEMTETEIVPVPMASRIVITGGVLIALVFGIWPAPLMAIAQHATLLFLP